MFSLSKEAQNALLEAGKEILRVSVMAMVGVALIQLENGQLNYKMVALAGIIAGLRGLDKFLHEYGKETKNDTLKRGLTQF